MKFLISMMFGAGVAAYTYSHFARRVGYSNTQNVVLVVGTVFVLTTLVFFTVVAFLLPHN